MGECACLLIVGLLCSRLVACKFCLFFRAIKDACYVYLSVPLYGYNVVGLCPFVIAQLSDTAQCTCGGVGFFVGIQLGVVEALQRL